MLDKNNCYLDTNIQFLYKNRIGLDEKFEFRVSKLNNIVLTKLIPTASSIITVEDFKFLYQSIFFFLDRKNKIEEYNNLCGFIDEYK